MLKYNCFLLSLLFSIALPGMAQQSNLASGKEQKSKALGMNPAQYQEYQNKLKQYGQQLTAIRQDPHLDDSARAKAIARVHAAIKEYQQHRLNAGQIKGLQEMRQADAIARGSNYQRQLRVHEMRMHKKDTGQIRVMNQ